MKETVILNWRSLHKSFPPLSHRTQIPSVSIFTKYSSTSQMHSQPTARIKNKCIRFSGLSHLVIFKHHLRYLTQDTASKNSTVPLIFALVTEPWPFNVANFICSLELLINYFLASTALSIFQATPLCTIDTSNLPKHNRYPSKPYAVVLVPIIWAWKGEGGRMNSTQLRIAHSVRCVIPWGLFNCQISS